MTLRLGVALGLATIGFGITAPAALAVEKIDATLIELPAPPEGKGQIVFFRKGGYVGSAVNCTVHENGQKVSSMGGGRYFILVAEPGRHEFTVKSESKDSLAVEVEPDETQFVSCKIKMGMFVGRPDIRPSTEAEFREAKLGLTDTDDMEAEAVLRPEQIEAALAAPAADETDAVVEASAEATAGEAMEEAAELAEEGEAVASEEQSEAEATVAAEPEESDETEEAEEAVEEAAE